MPKVSIVVSGGSSKGAYQIVFFNALKKCGLVSSIEAVSATSIGTINAYAFLTNKIDLAEQLWLNLNVNGIWNFKSKIKNENFLTNSLSKLISENDYIYCDFYATLSEMSTMSAQYFNLKGKINPLKKKILETSISIPLLTFPPFQQKDKIYFDGGVTDNIPITPIIDKKHDILFIVHFTPEYTIKSISTTLETDVIYINMSQSEKFKKGNFNFKREQVQEMIKEGERYTLLKINEYLLQKQQNTTYKRDINYYYFSGASLLELLNRLLRIDKVKRILYIRNIKRKYKNLKEWCQRWN